jgi:GT2 family glycosyltransferase
MNTSNNPLVSIVSINFNQLKVTEDFLKSVQKITYPNYEVIIVDNASKENSCPYIKKHYPWVKCLRSEENLGFAGGNNLGIRNAKGDYFMLINNDTEVDHGFLEPLVNAMIENPKIGMVGSKVRFFNKPDMIQFAGATPMTRFTATSHFIGFNQKDIGQYDEQKLTPFASGAAMMTNRKICQEVGLMASFFFLYYEELDWQERIRKADYEIHYIPNSLVFHKESVSVGRKSALQAYWKTRNRLLLIRRNFSNFNVFISYLYMTFFSTPYNILKYLSHFRWRSLKVHGIALGWHYINLFNKKRVHQNEYL